MRLQVPIYLQFAGLMTATIAIVFGSVFLLALTVGICLFLAGELSAQTVSVLVFGLISLEILAIGYVIAWDRYLFAQNAALASGEVLAVWPSTQRDAQGDTATTYSPKICFLTPRGRTIEFLGQATVHAIMNRGNESMCFICLPSLRMPASARSTRRGWR